MTLLVPVLQVLCVSSAPRLTAVRRAEPRLPPIGRTTTSRPYPLAMALPTPSLQEEATCAALESLEVSRVLAALALHARTEPGRAHCLELHLAADPAEARRRYALVAEAMDCPSSDSPPLDNKLRLEEAVRAAASRAPLRADELHDAADALSSLDALAAWGRRASRAPRLARLAAAAAPPPRLLQTFVGGFERLADGTTRLNASAWPRLAQRQAAARRAAETLRRRVEQLRLAPLQRDGRVVVAVSPSQKRAIGVEVARSRSGGTAFVEPFELVPLSSALRAANAAVASAEARILAALSSLLVSHADALRAALRHAGELDAYLARAHLARAHALRVPHVGAEGVIELRHARHPLLVLSASDPRDVIGNDLSLRTDSRGRQGIVLTGANGGGKSAILKTVGMAALLCRLAIPLPAEAEESADDTSYRSPRVDFFDAVVADVADSQSLQQGASSFVSHMRACKQALATADAARISGGRVLLLLDEPGASTDPAQGAAIAQAVAEHALDAGAILVASTHSSALTLFALQEDRLQVAAMALQPDGTPTFKMQLGAVGESHALEAAAREGLPEAIRARAAQLIPDQDEVLTRQRAEMEKLLVSLGAEREAAEAATADARADRRAAMQELAEARLAAAKAARSLTASVQWVDARRRRLDEFVLQLRSSGADAFTLLGNTLDSLRLARRDASTARQRALLALGLQPLPPEAGVKAGESFFIVDADEALERSLPGSAAAALPLIEGAAAADSAPLDSSVRISIDGAPAVAIPKEELAQWLISSADDLHGLSDTWAWMGSDASVVPSSSMQSSSKRRRKR
ncbi:hypothetical protein AB1Y20_008277 [Prymnesium parvum]|uniref:DNA mismatch repair proteins mutS family domain-containing protein n=1 Tax=Prymnesium parvum TaxID=97485 RepID=A0AB34IWE0_PRYPA